MYAISMRNICLPYGWSERRACHAFIFLISFVMTTEKIYNRFAKHHLPLFYFAIPKRLSIFAYFYLNNGKKGNY